MTSYLLFLIILIISLVPATATAEEIADKGDFFDTDFARNPNIGAHSPGSKPTPPSAKENSSEEQPASEEQDDTIEDIDTSEEDPPEDPSLPDQTSKLNPPSYTRSVNALGGILNSKDRRHFEDSLRQLIDVASSRKLPLGIIYHVGDYRNVSAELSQIVDDLGGTIAPVTKPPAQYRVTKSPTWIIHTEAGEVLIEGAGPIEKYINAAGKFVAPSWERVSAVSQSTPGSK